MKTVDEVILLHNNFLDQCLNECLLTNEKIRSVINTLNMKAYYFSRVIVRFFQSSTKGFEADGEEQAAVDYFLREDHHLLN